jgi:hypothetical protein
MIPPAHLVQGRAAKARHQRANLFSRAKGVSTPLHEQHRLLDVREVRIATLLGSPRRVQRIAEKDEPGDAGDALGRDLRRDAASHRFSADEQRKPG